MAGRESEYMRGVMVGVGAIIELVTMQEKVLDKSNVAKYAREIINQQMEYDNAKSY